MDFIMDSIMDINRDIINMNISMDINRDIDRDIDMDIDMDTDVVHRREPQFHREVGDLLVAYLKQLSVDYVFGIPGGAIEPLYNALARGLPSGGPRPIVTRHETGAAFMADGYTVQTGKLGVCCATTGPGATNLITGVASAYENHIPMLVITGQTALTNFGRGAIQESSCTGINTVGMFQYCTRYNSLISHVDQFERKLAAAVMSAYQSPSGPVHLSIPLDILRSSTPVAGPSYNLAALLRRPSLVDLNAVDELCQQIGKARKIVFMIGERCNEAINAILELALLLNAAIVTTPHGKGLIDPYHPLFRGVIGFAGHSTASDTLTDPQVDTVVAVGTNLGEFASNAWDTQAILNCRLIHVESTESYLIRSPMASLHVRGRLSTIFAYLLEAIHKHLPKKTPIGQLERRNPGSRMRESPIQELKRHFRFDDETKYYDDSIPIKPQRLMRELSRLFPPGTMFLADTGNSLAWTIHYLQPNSDQRTANQTLFRSSLDFTSMGWAIGAAIGTALGRPHHPVICITGDGSFLMSGQEITVAIQERLPVVFIILNDCALGMVKHGQRLAGSEPVGFELPEVDYCALAKALGAAAYTIRSPQDLLDLDVDAICQRAGPTLLDVRIDPEEIPPIGMRVRVLGD